MENLDPEIKAMSTLAATLEGLDTEVRGRVLRWAADKFSVTINASTRVAGGRNEDDKADAKPARFTDFVDLYHAVSPTSNLEKMLTAAYWLQVIQGAGSWQSREVNDILKNTNNGIRYIIDTLDSARSKTPALVGQISKSGKSAQARKTYKLTAAGISLIAAKTESSAATADAKES